jgi:general secretion pathway protein A
VYEDYYQLTAKPFRLSPDPGFFFASRGHKRALAYLRYGLSQDEGFVVITGAPGTGKTTLAQILLKEMDQTHLVVAHLTTSQLEAEELLRMVLASFGLRYDGVNKAGMLKTMEAFLLARSRERKRVLLVVDEAQNLPPSALEELRMLSNLQVGDKALVQTFLLGQAQFRTKLDHPDLEQFRQRVIANYHLSELAEDECQSYIETRLRYVGWTGDPEFTPEAYQGIYNYTQGIPRRINMLSDRLLLFGFLEERHEIDEAVFNEVTDEMQQEISGKPVERNSTAYDEVETMNQALDEQQEQSLSSASKSEVAEVENKKAETKKTGSRKTGSRKTGSRKTSRKKTNNKKSADVEETVNEVLNKLPDKPAAVASPPEGSVLDKAAPDVGYDEMVAMAQTDESETSDDRSKERFQVISGGRGQPDMQIDKVTIPLMQPGNHPPHADTASSSDNESNESKDVVLRKILRLVLAYHRSPRSFPGLQDPTQPLPKGISQILTLANTDDETLKNFRQIAAMGISPAMLRAAVRFFVRRVLFQPGGDEYRVLGLSSDATQDQVEGHYGLLMRLMRQEKRSAEESSVNRIGEAYENLCKGISTRSPKESVVEETAFSDFENEAYDEDDKLDLDLAPVGMDQTGIKRHGADAMAFSLDKHVRSSNEIITSKHKSRFTSTRVMLGMGAVVVVAVLYFTQMPSTTTDADKVAASDTQTATEKSASSQTANGQTANSQPANTQTANTQKTQTTASTQTATKATKVASSTDSTVAAKTAQKAEALKQARLKEQAKLEAELKQAQLAKAAEEKKVQQEAAAAAAAEAKARATARAEAAAAAKARAELKAKQEAQARAAAAARAAKAKEVQASVTPPAPVTNAQPASTAASTNTSASGSGNPGAAALNNTVASLERAYNTGNLDNFMDLFSKNPRTNNHTDQAGLRDEYRSFFSKTDLRNLTIKNIDWDIEFNYALGTGNYEQIIKERGKPDKLLKRGKATIQLGHEGGQMKITRLYFSDPYSVTKLNVDSSPRATDGVLNELLGKFVKTYEDGQIEPFMSLFAANAKTNDRQNPAGIREDYAGLFSSTSMRKMTLKNMNWAWEDGTAKSTGSFVVEVQPNGKDTTSTYKGKLWFNVALVKGQPKITYFAFRTQ